MSNAVDQANSDLCKAVMEKYHHNSVNTGELKCVSQKDGQEGILKTPAVMKEKNVATTERNLR